MECPAQNQTSRQELNGLRIRLQMAKTYRRLMAEFILSTQEDRNTVLERADAVIESLTAEIIAVQLALV